MDSIQPDQRRGLPAWLASVLMQRGGSILPRYAYYRQRLAHLPRAWRRRLGRKVAAGLGGAALLLALAGPLTLAQPQQPAAADAVITVINGAVGIASNGQCSLVEAIQNANSVTTGRPYPDCAAGNPNGADTINLPANGVFTLTSAFVSEAEAGPIGLPWISSTMTINGNGSTIQRRSDAAQFRVMAVGRRGNLALNDVTIRGGALYVGHEDHTVYDADGGGILNQGQLTISGSVVADNFALSYWYGGGGGGIHNTGTLTISSSVISNNRAEGLTEADGGGIANFGSLTVTNSTISGNSAAARYGDGGGISSGGSMTINNSTIRGNELYAAYHSSGAAIAAWGTTSIVGSTIVGNRVTGEELPYTYYNHEGAISNDGAMTIVNSTITGNETFFGSSAIGNYGNLTVVSSTITGNNVGIATLCSDRNSITYLHRSIVSGNTEDEARIAPQGACTATIIANNYNVFGRHGRADVIGFVPGPTDIVPAGGIATILSPLADNGGPTLTHALPPGSPARDLAPNATCAAAPVNGLDQRGQPRNLNGAGGASANECDAGAFEAAAGATTAAFYVSTTVPGTVDGVTFTAGDILKFTPGNGWSMFFDASDVGISKNVSAFEIEAGGDILLSLAAAQSVAPLGIVAPQDVIRFRPTSTGDTTAGSFALVFDGSANLLTTSNERIDALALAGDGRLALSTFGAAAVKRPNGTVLKAQDEDALGFNLASGQWSEYFNGTAIPGLAAEDINALWIDPATGDLYISIVGGFNLGGVGTPSVQGDGKDIVKLSPSGAPGGYTPSLFWDGSANGFPAGIDGLEMIP